MRRGFSLQGMTQQEKKARRLPVICVVPRKAGPSSAIEI